jgi:hypothetical protein
MAVDTVFVVAVDYVIFGIIVMGFVSALVHANLASYALVLVSFNNEFRFYVALHFFAFEDEIARGFKVLSLPMTGSPPRGLQTLSRFREMSWMADSSEDKYSV